MFENMTQSSSPLAGLAIGLPMISNSMIDLRNNPSGAIP